MDKEKKRKIIIAAAAAGIVIIAALPFVIKMISKTSSPLMKENRPSEAEVAEKLKTEFYGNCKDETQRYKKLNEFAAGREIGNDAPQNLNWCRFGWIIPDKSAQWWAIDMSSVKQLKLETAGNQLITPVEYVAYTLTDSIIPGKKPALESKKLRRGMYWQYNTANNVWYFSGSQGLLDAGVEQ